MSRLVDIQTALMHDIYHNEQTSAPYLDTGRLGSLERLNIYSNNLRLTLSGSLSNVYPIVEQLVGSAFFQQQALDYLNAYPLHQGNRNQFGHAFSGFLAEQPALADMPYIAEVAAIEWAYFQASIADNAEPLSFEQLQQAIHNPNYVLSPHPSTAWIYNTYNSVEIWQQHQQGALDELELKESGQHWLIWRNTSHEVLFKPIPSSLVLLIEQSQNGHPFSDIMASFDEQTDLTALQHSFSDAITYGVFTY